MKSLTEVLVNKSNIKKIVLNHTFDSYKKKDLKAGDLCLTGDGDVGIVITAQINNEMNIISLPNYDEDDKIIIFNGSRKTNFSYLPLNTLDDNLKDIDGDDDFSVKKVYPQHPPKDVFSSKEKLYNYLAQIARNIF